MENVGEAGAKRVVIGGRTRARLRAEEMVVIGAGRELQAEGKA